MIGYVGDSGNADLTASRLFVEIRRPDGTSIDPAWSLDAAVDDGWLCAPETAVTDEWIVVSGVAVAPTGFRPLDGAGCVADIVETPPSTTSGPTTTATTTPAATPVETAAEPPIVALVASAPRAPTVIVFGASVRVSFLPPTSNGGAPITSYTATCASGNGGTTRAGSASASPVNVYNLTLGRTYRCNVRASNADGAGPASAVSAPFVAIAPLSAPRNLTAPVTPSPGAGSGPVRLWWQVPGEQRRFADHRLHRPALDERDDMDGRERRRLHGHVDDRLGARQRSPLLVPGRRPQPARWWNLVSGGQRHPTLGTHSTTITHRHGLGDERAVRFGTPTSNGGAAITRYTATCASSNGGTARSGTATASPVPVYNLTANRLYRCVVRATNAVGTSPSSSPTVSFCAGIGCEPTGDLDTRHAVEHGAVGRRLRQLRRHHSRRRPDRPSNLYAQPTASGSGGRRTTGRRGPGRTTPAATARAPGTALVASRSPQAAARRRSCTRAASGARSGSGVHSTAVSAGPGTRSRRRAGRTTTSRSSIRTTATT